MIPNFRVRFEAGLIGCSGDFLIDNVLAKAIKIYLTGISPFLRFPGLPERVPEILNPSFIPVPFDKQKI